MKYLYAETAEMAPAVRVFARRTSYTPIDERAVVGCPQLWHGQSFGEIHVSVVFTWDIPRGQWLKGQWESHGAIVKIGGPAFGLDGDPFRPGKYVRPGVTITTRGCHFRCPWCLVPESEGPFRELAGIAVGNIVQDNNILLSNRAHLGRLFQMLKTQSKIRFVGGLDVRLLRDWHVEELRGLRIEEIWIALDSERRKNLVKAACRKLRSAGFKRRQIRCYVLAGHKELIQESEGRLRFAYECGALPFIQVYQDGSLRKRMAGQRSRADNLFVHRWSRPAVIKAIMEHS